MKLKLTFSAAIAFSALYSTYIMVNFLLPTTYYEYIDSLGFSGCKETKQKVEHSNKA